MRRAAAALVGLALALGAGCQTGRMHQGTLEVDGPGTEQERLGLAQRAAKRCYADGALKGAIVGRFPGMQEADLLGMFMHWAPVTLDQHGRRGVVVQFGVREVDDRVPVAEVLAFIRERCAAALAEERALPPPAASSAPARAVSAPAAPAPAAPSAAAPAAPGAP